MNVIVSFYVDCGRQGDVEGLFVCDKAALEASYGKEVYFGEILGKHSEVIIELDESCFEIKSDDQEFIAKFVEIIGDGTVSGYNPFDYMDDDGDSDGESDEDEDD